MLNKLPDARSSLEPCCFATVRTRLPIHRHARRFASALGPGTPYSSRLFTEDVPRQQGDKGIRQAL